MKWVCFGLGYALCSALWIPIRLYSALYGARLSFSCTSPDSLNVRITCFCSLLCFPTCWTFSQLLLKAPLSVSLTRWSWLHYLQGRLKIKHLRGVRSQNVSGKDLCRPSFFIRTHSHSLALITVLLHLEQPYMNQRRHAVLPCEDLCHFCCWSRAKAFCNAFVTTAIIASFS